MADKDFDRDDMGIEDDAEASLEDFFQPPASGQETSSSIDDFFSEPSPGKDKEAPQPPIQGKPKDAIAEVFGRDEAEDIPGIESEAAKAPGYKPPLPPGDEAELEQPVSPETVEQSAGAEIAAETPGEAKKKISLSTPLLVAGLVILILALGLSAGYLVYDKFLSPSKEKTMPPAASSKEKTTLAKTTKRPEESAAVTRPSGPVKTETTSATESVKTETPKADLAQKEKTPATEKPEKKAEPGAKDEGSGKKEMPLSAEAADAAKEKKTEIAAAEKPPPTEAGMAPAEEKPGITKKNGEKKTQKENPVKSAEEEKKAEKTASAGAEKEPAHPRPETVAKTEPKTETAPPAESTSPGKLPEEKGPAAKESKGKAKEEKPSEIASHEISPALPPPVSSTSPPKKKSSARPVLSDGGPYSVQVGSYYLEASKEGPLALLAELGYTDYRFTPERRRLTLYHVMVGRNLSTGEVARVRSEVEALGYPAELYEGGVKAYSYGNMKVARQTQKKLIAAGLHDVWIKTETGTVTLDQLRVGSYSQARAQQAVRALRRAGFREAYIVRK